MRECSLPNTCANDLVSVLQLHFDVAGVESTDLVKKKVFLLLSTREKHLIIKDCALK
jgi:hypothetical protein